MSPPHDKIIQIMDREFLALELPRNLTLTITSKNRHLSGIPPSNKVKCETWLSNNKAIALWHSVEEAANTTHDCVWH